MSVATPIIDYIDGATRRIYLKQGVSDYYPIEDVYHEYRNLRRLDETLRKWEPLLKAEGNVPKGAGAFTPRYVVLLDGTKIVPFDESLQLNQLGDMITDNPDVDATLYDISGLTTAKPIFIKPSEAETIQLNSDAIEFSSYGGGVNVSVTKGVPGTTYPIGTPRTKVNNIPDAITIVQASGIQEVIKLYSDITLGVGAFLDFYKIEGQSHVRTNVFIETIADVEGLSIEKCIVNGTLDGDCEIHDCVVGDIHYFNGHIHNSGLIGRITLGGGASAYLGNCNKVDINLTPTVDMGGNGQNLVMTNYSGSVRIENMTGSKVGIGLASGTIILDSTTVTSGSVTVTGIGALVDENGNRILSGTWNGGVQIQNLLLNIDTIAEATKFGVAVYIDINGKPGIENPIGLERSPVNNLADAMIIANKRNTSKLFFLSDFTIKSTDVLTAYELYGSGWQNQTLTFEAGSIVAYCDTHNLTVTGWQTGLTAMNDCKVVNFGSVGLAPSSQNVVLKRCLLSGTITLPSNYSGTIVAIDCYSDKAAIPYTTLDMGDSTANIIMRNYAGQAEIANMTQGNFIDVTFTGGEMKLRTESVTSGTVHALGPGLLESWPEHVQLENETIWNGGVQIYNETTGTSVGTGGDSVWTEIEKDEVLEYSKIASDNAKQANLKL